MTTVLGPLFLRFPIYGFKGLFHSNSTFCPMFEHSCYNYMLGNWSNLYNWDIGEIKVESYTMAFVVIRAQADIWKQQHPFPPHPLRNKT